MTVRQIPARLIDAGRVTIPAEVRKDLDLDQGDYVILDVRPFDGEDSP